jgi:hypothetical protein
LRLAGVWLPDQRQKVLQTSQRFDGDNRPLLEAQRCTARAIEHPRWNPKTIAPLILRNMTAQDGLARASELAVHDQLLPEQRVPRILHAAPAGFLVSVCLTSRLTAATTNACARARMRAAISGSSGVAAECCG